MAVKSVAYWQILLQKSVATFLVRPNPWNAGQPLTDDVRLVPGQELSLQCCN